MKTQIKKVITKNFKGLGDFEYTPRSKGVNTIYGENGSGKSSLVGIFNYLTIVMESISIRHEMAKNINVFNGQMLVQPELERPYDQFVTVDSNDQNISVELFIEIDSVDYSYKVEMDFMSIITYEHLYELKKTDGGIKKIIFRKSSSENKFEIDQGILKETFTNMNEVDTETPASLISIMTFNERNHKSNTNDFIKEKMSIVSRLIYSFGLVSISSSETNKVTYFKRPITLLPIFDINLSDRNTLNRFEKEVELFDEFVTSIDDKIISVSMKRQDVNFGIQKGYRLSLEFEVNIAGKIRKLPIEKMSAGTQDYLKYFRMVLIMKGDAMGTICDTVTIFDEFGIHLHPTLATNMMNYINKISNESGHQSIVTTHQTMFLNKKYSSLDNKQKQILSRDVKGNASIKTLEGSNNRENQEEKYLRGEHGGPRFGTIKDWEE